MDIIKVIKSSKFAFAFVASVGEFRKVSDLAIGGFIFEERVHRALVEIGVESDWQAKAQSHKSGADVLGLSLKTNKVKILRGTPHTGLTSYRTASFPDWDSKKNFIEIQDSLVKGYLFLARSEYETHTTHHLYLIQKDLFSFLNINNYTVSEKDGNFTGIRANGVSFEIRKSTSGQLIFRNIPLTSIEKYRILTF